MFVRESSHLFAETPPNYGSISCEDQSFSPCYPTARSLFSTDVFLTVLGGLFLPKINPYRLFTESDAVELP